ncbi:glycosyltransferase [Brucella anthropi]|uniref:Glycosyltransferase n=1 Tax=Brucella anthropi TaxID=529 RepID=A0A6L3YYA2_BRUAN|nr:glycosyltransferase [Brucella anthropi]KAB2725362.1 glycosyltransferase [Brucella anthropi]KAB2757553.1 glycosyltransferase [Brucella anthropi]
MFPFERHGYVFQENLQVWMRPEYSGINYSDGDAAEQHLGNVIRNACDLSVFSFELRLQCRDWQTLYHLSAQRSNVLRPFEHLLRGKVLEIGAGCGAITRYLGEASGQILALEGSPRRAAIAANRVRDLRNVAVLAERFDAFETDELFDAVTLIGVLEYASLFSDDIEPARHMLEKVRGMLKPNGYLFIAIENQLGLKYFAGAPEDHLGQPMYGIENRYEPGQVKTYGRHTLEELLRHAGYASVDFMASFPDYKLPKSIITEAGCMASDFDAAAFAWQSVHADPQMPATSFFDMTRSWPIVFDNGLGIDLANSFIVAASPSDIHAVPTSHLAYHYNTERLKPYCKETRFFRNTQNHIEVSYHRLVRNTEGASGSYRLNLPEHDTYWKGELLSQKFLRIVSTPGWSCQEAAGFVRVFLDHLRMLLELQDQPVTPLNDCACQIPGIFLDALPHNIILDSEDIPRLFDCEWVAETPIELGRLLCRGLFHLFNQAEIQQPHADLENLSRGEVVLRILAEAGLPLADAELLKYRQSELNFQHIVSGLPLEELDSWQLNTPLMKSNAQTASLYFAEAGAEFNERSCLHQALHAGQQNIQFHLDSSIPLSRLRLDPFDGRGGWFVIHGIQVFDEHGNLYYSFTNSDVQSLGLNGIVRCRAEAGEVLFLAYGHDPQLLLPDLPEVRISTFSVHIELLGSDEVAERYNLSNAQSSISPGENQIWSGEAGRLTDFFQDQLALSQKNLTMLLTQLHEQQIQHSAHLEEVRIRLDGEQKQKNHFQNELALSHRNIAALQAQLYEHQQQVQYLTDSVTALRSSTSWRITRPIRLVRHLVRIIRSTLQSTRLLLHRHGLRKVLMRGSQILIREGISGLISHLRHQRTLLINAPEASVSNPIRTERNALTCDSQGRYRLSPAPQQYCYIPPAPPQDLDARLAAISSKPYFSIVVPVYNTTVELLEQLLQSVREQWYPHWQLILADDCSPSEETQSALAKIKHPQITILRLANNQGISGATNAAIGAAQGDFIVFLDHDDELTTDCLYELALCIEKETPDFIYSDEDKLAEDGSYTQPHFKPDWSPDTMMSTMFTCHVSCVRRSLLEKTGLLRSQYDGCQDWDFVLRIAEHTQRISHIPKVLYHWRIIPGSIAADIAAKSYVLEASRQVRLDALQRRRLVGKVEAVPQMPEYFRVNYQPQGEPTISIIIPTRDNAEVLRRCIDSIRSKTRYAAYELIILDNGSIKPATLAYLNSLGCEPTTRIIRHDAPFNFSELNNIGAKAAKGEILLFLNDDTQALHEDWLERLVGYAQLPHVGAVGAKLLYPDGHSIQHAGVVNLADGPMHAFLRQHRDHAGYYMRSLLEYNWLAVTGACLMIETHKYWQIGGFDEKFPVAYNDIDLCMSASSQGYYNVVCQAVQLIHHESISRGIDDIDPVKRTRLQDEQRRLYAKHPEFYQYDPYYNLNLHPNGFNFEVPN